MAQDKLQVTAFSSVLEQLREESRQYFSEPSVGLHPVSGSEQPSSRVLQVRVEGKARTRHIFLKRLKYSPPAHARSPVAAEFEALRRAGEALGGCPGLNAARPIACFPDEFTLVTEAAPGRNVHEILKQPRFWPLAGRSTHDLIHTFERVGLWLKAFQGAGSPDGRISIPALREDLRVRLDKLVHGPAGFSVSDGDALLAYFDAHCEEIRDSDLKEVPVHADFCPHNVLAQGDEITVIDFSTVRTGAKLHDLTHMFMHLEKLKARPWIGGRFVEELQRAMLRSFDPTLDPHRPQFQILLLRHMVCQLLVCPQAPLLHEMYRWYMWREQRRRLRSILYWQSPATLK